MNRYGHRLGFAAFSAAFLCASLFSAPVPGHAQVQASPGLLKPAPLNPAFERYRAEKTSLRATAMPQTPEGHFLGHIPPPFKLPPAPASYAASLSATALPTKFDLRHTNPVGVTAVKDQGECGDCWAFATMSTLESYLKYKKGVAAPDLSESDLNENHLWDPAPCMGGDWGISAAYLARWAGPVSEADVPYPYWLTETVQSSAVAAADKPVLGAASGVPAGYHVQNIYWLPQQAKPLSSADRTTLKTAIQANGAVQIAYHAPETTTENTSYYNAAKYAYYCTTAVDTNHEVAIVGWDDAFPKTSFKTAPAGNGAWIVKNSWGTGWGDKGYFYMSYYDKSLEIGAQYTGVYPATNYSRIYQYDKLGLVNFFGYGQSTSFWFANVFMASANAKTIKAVGLFTPTPNAAYEIRIYSNVNASTSGTVPTAGKLVATKKGTLAKPGFSTVMLTTPGVVTANAPFSVVVNLSTPGNEWPIPVEYSVPGYSTAATACPGQSFVSTDGTTWYNAQFMNDQSQVQDFHVCVRAYAVK